MFNEDDFKGTPINILAREKGEKVEDQYMGNQKYEIEKQ